MSNTLEENGEQHPNHRQLLTILASHGLKVHESDVRDQIPVAINYEGFQALQPTGIGALGELVDRSRSYLSGNFVEDDFGDTFEGRQKRQNTWSGLEKQYGKDVTDIQQNDKLKMGSSVGTIKAYFEWLVGELNADSVHSGTANGVRELYKKFLATIPFTEKDGQMTLKEEYIHKTFEQKKAIAKDIDAVLREFIDLVSTEPL